MRVTLLVDCIYTNYFDLSNLFEMTTIPAHRYIATNSQSQTVAKIERVGVVIMIMRKIAPRNKLIMRESYRSKFDGLAAGSALGQLLLVLYHPGAILRSADRRMVWIEFLHGTHSSFVVSVMGHYEECVNYKVFIHCFRQR